MGNIMKLHFKPNKLWYAIYSTSMTFTWLMSSSVVQASDLQIYASPTAGKKTIVMMLDTSGSMGRTIQSGYSIYDDYGITSCSTTYVNSTTTPSYRRYYCGVSSNTTNSKVTNLATGCEKQADNSYRCYDRLTRLKDGMFSFLENNNPIFNNVSVGLGHFSTYSSGTTGDGSSGEILVPAANLGVVGSAQRVALKNAVAGLEASGGTPTANAYAEAAAYLMGTRTLSSTTANVAMYFKYYPVLTQTSQTVYYACGNNSASGSTDNTKCTYTPTTIPSQSNLSNYSSNTTSSFYEPPTVTIHDYGVRSFITVGIASGDRSTPLDVYPIIGREGMSPSTALSGRPVNNVYGIIDRDFIKKNLMSLSESQLETKDLIRSNLRKNPQILRAGETSVGQVFFPSTGIGQAGWYRSLSSTSNGTEKADNSFRIKGGMKAFEEPIAITGNLIVPVYDPQGTGIVASDPCLPRVVGETDRQTYCLPFGVCLNTDGSINHNKEDNSGFGTDGTKNLNVIGSGVRNITFVPSEDNPSPQNSCGKLKLSGNEQGTGQWQCTSYLIPARWYERYR